MNFATLSLKLLPNITTLCVIVTTDPFTFWSNRVINTPVTEYWSCYLIFRCRLGNNNHLCQIPSKYIYKEHNQDLYIMSKQKISSSQNDELTTGVMNKRLLVNDNTKWRLATAFFKILPSQLLLHTRGCLNWLVPLKIQTR